MLDDMNYSGKEIIRAVQMITDLSEIQSGNYELNLSTVSVTKIIQDLLTEHDTLCHRNGVDMTVDSQAKTDKIKVDEYAFQQILSNLLDNAIKNTSNGRVEINVSDMDKGWLEIMIRDTGTGIAMDFQNEMFEPFRRNRKTRPGDHGLGLGLTLTREYCRLTEAELKLESEEGEGTTVKLRIPMN